MSRRDASEYLDAAAEEAVKQLVDELEWRLAAPMARAVTNSLAETGLERAVADLSRTLQGDLVTGKELRSGLEEVQDRMARTTAALARAEQLETLARQVEGMAAESRQEWQQVWDRLEALAEQQRLLLRLAAGSLVALLLALILLIAG